MENVALRNAREGAKLTQTTLAALAGISQSSVSRLEAGVFEGRAETLRRIREALDAARIGRPSGETTP